MDSFHQLINFLKNGVNFGVKKSVSLLLEWALTAIFLWHSLKN
jgi:hypothetical protein